MNQDFNTILERINSLFIELEEVSGNTNMCIDDIIFILNEEVKNLNKSAITKEEKWQAFMIGSRFKNLKQCFTDMYLLHTGSITSDNYFLS
jgi:hypothetical protein